jgi:hypothetical protein
MLQVECLRHQADALLRLSQEVEKSGVSAELQEMVEELRIMVSVADVTILAADLDRERPYPGVRHSDLPAGSGKENERPARTFSLTLLRSRRRARRALSA